MAGVEEAADMKGLEALEEVPVALEEARWPWRRSWWPWRRRLGDNLR